MTGLLPSDPHHWAPVTAVVDHVASLIPEGARVLEIGPGHVPFRRANHFVDYVQRGNLPISICDVANEPLPFDDKSVDFIYCRHVLEDMFNPFPLLREMERVGKAGYIETPSPIAELCRGVDGGAPPYRGYHHHRFIVWVHGDQVRFVSKYPMVEYLRIDDDQAAHLLRQSPVNWNTYYLWRGSINWKHIQNDLDFDLPNDYQHLLSNAYHSSLTSNVAFRSQMQSDTIYRVSVLCNCGNVHASLEEWRRCPQALVPRTLKYECFATHNA